MDPEKSKEDIIPEKTCKVEKNNQKNKSLDFIRNITIEPGVFLIIFANSLVEPLFPQFVITKICSYDFGFNETVCDDENLVTEYQEVNDEIQKVYAEFNVYILIVATTIPIFASFYMGAWCDTFGRKLLMKIYLVSKLFTKAALILNAYFMNISKYWIFLVFVPNGIAGGEGVFYLSMYAFMADITTPENRAFRYGMLQVAISLAAPLSPIVGSYIYSNVPYQYRYVGVFLAALMGTIVGGTYLLIRIRSYEWKPQKKEVDRSVFSIKHPIDCLKTVFKKREGPNRKYILLFITIVTMWIILILGEGGLVPLYMRTKYEWYYPQIAKYTTVTKFSEVVAQAVMIPLLSYFGVNESLIMVFIMISGVARQFIQGLAETSWMFYLGALINSLGPYCTSILTAMQVACVPQDEIGKISAARTAIEMILPVPFNFLYQHLWALTSLNYPSAIFLFSGGIASVATILTIYIHISLHGKTMAEVTAAGANRPVSKKEEVMINFKGKIIKAEMFKISSI